MPELPEVEALTRFLTGHVAGRRIERCELGAIAALKTSRPTLAVQIRAHKELSVQKLMDVMDAVKEAGITKIGIVSTVPEGQ